MEKRKIVYEIEFCTDEIFYDCQMIDEDKREEFIQNILSQPGGKLINNGGRPRIID